jgi:nitrogenase molybdenum-iron protein beta chain
MFLTRHFKDPVMAATSAFTEGASVFGGGANLTQACRNLFDTYDPEVIAVHTTCLSETIGDDLNAIVQAMDIPEDKYIVYCNTPSYVGSHITGYASMLAGFVKQLAQKPAAKPTTTDGTNQATSTPTAAPTPVPATATAPTVPSAAAPMAEPMPEPAFAPAPKRLALFAGFVNPGDMRELKRLAEEFDICYTQLPDTSGVLDAPMTGTYQLYPAGGTPVAAIKNLGESSLGLAVGQTAAGPAALALSQKCSVAEKIVPLPIGIRLTDEYLMALSSFAQADVPECLEEERGQLVDILLDVHPYLDGKTCAIFGDPDTIYGLTSATLEMGMIPKYVFTTSPFPAITKQINELFEQYQLSEQCLAKDGADLFELHQRVIQEPVDVLIGNSFGKQIARAENIPLVRLGFPIIDRYVHSYLPIVGYRGGMRIVEAIANAIMDRQDRECNDEDFEMVM